MRSGLGAPFYCNFRLCRVLFFRSVLKRNCCSSGCLFSLEADNTRIDTLRTLRPPDVTTAKIINREQEVVFSSADMDIDVWESNWKNEKRRQSVNVEERDCPYENISCFFDDLCVQCKMDKLQDEF